MLNHILATENSVRHQALCRPHRQRLHLGLVVSLPLGRSVRPVSMHRTQPSIRSAV